MMSILVSSVAACACSHHSVPRAETKKSCHSHSERATNHDGGRTSAEYKGQIVSGSGCSCAQASPRLVFKQDQKQLQISPATAPSAPTDPQFVAALADVPVDNFGSQSFTQSFLIDSTQGRAPPRLKIA
jgi:hypothetical protein